MVNRLHLTVS